MYKESYEFPAIIINHGSEDYEIKIYDFEGVSVYSDDLDLCYSDIRDALEAEIYKYICLNKEIPSPTPKEDIPLEYNHTLFTMKVDTEQAIKNSKRNGVIVPDSL